MKNKFQLSYLNLPCAQAVKECACGIWGIFVVVSGRGNVFLLARGVIAQYENKKEMAVCRKRGGGRHMNTGGKTWNR